eukprot:gb/GEZN01001461.1/.p1 GENE.gb/GEZN01001461.1/~~gb/GEZN01001461.1/.p1  ORF type:complete len:767 (+),score=101.04 gb/GEZN01001461.1/:26-2326(+)
MATWAATQLVPSHRAMIRAPLQVGAFGLGRSPTALAHRPCNMRTLSNMRNFNTVMPRRSFSGAASIRNWGRWLTDQTPKGFREFFDKSAKKEGGEGGSNNDNGGNKKKDKKNDPDDLPKLMSLLVGAGIASYLVAFVFFEKYKGTEITWQQFRNKYLEAGLVKSILVERKEIAIATLTDGDHVHFQIGSVESFEDSLREAQESLGISSEEYIDVKYSNEFNHVPVLLALAVSMILFAKFVPNSVNNLGGMGGRSGKRNIFSIGKANAKLTKPGEVTNTKFDDVAGLDEAKIEIREFVEFLKNPAKFTNLGAKIPKGCLLEGPPGTGKTMLAKATAGEASVPFYSISGPDFIEMFVGVGASRVRDLFAEARENAPCIIWIDEIDAVGAKRSSGQFSGSNSERDNTLNQLLVEMDGFSSSDHVVVLAGTNRKDMLDKALLRPGRLDRHISISLPDIRGREEMFKVHLRPLKIRYEKDDLPKRLAALTPGFSGADIANLCNEAALIAARKDKDAVHLVDFEAAADRVIGGLEKSNHSMTQREKILVATHEAGHAVCGWFLEHASPLLKVTVVPRASGALGFAQYLPNELALYQKDQLQHMVIMALGGRAAEEVFFGKISTGAADDLKKVTSIAMSQATVYGMSDALGHVSYYDGDDQFRKPFSEATAQMIDLDVRRTVTEAYTQALALVRERRDLVQALADRLLKDETVNHDVLLEILGDRPFKTDGYRSYLAEKLTDAEHAQAKAEKVQEAEVVGETTTSSTQKEEQG